MKAEDSGKVWFPGTFGPVMAVRVGDKVFSLGAEQGQVVDYWVEEDYLCVDLHDRKAKTRIARRFPLNTVPMIPATLFGGFEMTQHADVKVATHKDPGVEDWRLSGADYDNGGVAQLNGREFWEKAEFPGRN